MKTFVSLSYPVPRDLELPLPLPEGLLTVLLVLSFLLHILFVNLTVGSSILTTLFEGIAYKTKHKKFDEFAYRLAETITVNKSIAVVLGIGPLLCINLLYTIQFYSANALTGHAWSLIVPLVISAFLLSYVHKFKWHVWTAGRQKQIHLAVGASASILFMMIPLIFLSNINLMLFPNKWLEVRGFLSSLFVGNVFPRYFHFLCASLAITGLFITGWMGRKAYPIERLQDFTRQDVVRLGYLIAFRVTAAQFFFGPLLLFTLPSVGLSKDLYVLIFSGAALGLYTLFYMKLQLKREDLSVDKHFATICVLFSVVVLSMGTGRHLYRETALVTHKQLVQERSEDYRSRLSAFNERAESSEKVEVVSEGEMLFATCAVCHALDKTLVGPSLTEIAGIYPNNPGGIVTWAMNPGKKRADMPQMPGFSHIGPEKLRLIADYMLQMAGSTP